MDSINSVNYNFTESMLRVSIVGKYVLQILQIKYVVSFSTLARLSFVSQVVVKAPAISVCLLFLLLMHSSSVGRVVLKDIDYYVNWQLFITPCALFRSQFYSSTP